ncbi:MAG: hypothetical protein OXI34_07230 [Chloroflexota bacterium]|nr:hypothetical protein [Chloroflexota bacterium]MDE2855561.1 hypothetical protein [Chloroflexota bacterium]MDE2946405.1 hypothetical protein [Chloroflexota bacterium]
MPLNYLIKPSVETKFYIDFDWWEQSRDDLQVYLLTHLTAEQQQTLQQRDLREVFDYVHPETGEVFPVDALGLAIRESSKRQDFITGRIGLIDSVFRALLVNDNHPLNALELAKVTGRDASTILKTIGGVRIYRGIRPFRSGAAAEG